MRKYLIVLLAYAFLFNQVTAGVVRYVKRSGGVTSGEALTEGTAWTWQHAVNPGSALDGGDTIQVAPMSGNFDSLFTDTGDGGSNLNRIMIDVATAPQPVWIMPKPGTRITLYSDYIAPWVLVQFGDSDPNAGNDGKHIIFQGFDLVHTNPAATDEAQLVAINADSCFVLGNNIHDAMSMGITDYAANGSTVADNILNYNGRQTNIPQHGYGAYVQNKGLTSDPAEDAPPKRWFDNFVFANWDLGIQFYGSTATALANLSIRRNIFVNNGNLADNGGVEKFTYAFVLGPGETGVRAAKDTLVGNHGFFSTAPSTNQIFNIGYNGDAMFQVRLDSGMYVSNPGTPGLEFTVGTTGITVQGNTTVGGWSPGGLNTTFTQNIWHSVRPTGAVDSIFINESVFNPDRANVIIYNWDGSATSTFDPSSFLNEGDSYVIVSPTNFYDTLYTGTYSGPITVTLADITVATPIGSFDNAPRNPAPYFATLIVFRTEEGEAPFVPTGPRLWVR